ncbi:MAG: ABC transporter substrate-binding protein [Pigmentiphaga sp.]|nr:ABC transporter substrate-binding protein [Pigmentiphaga sp.]
MSQPRPDTLWYTRCPVPTASTIAIRQGWLTDTFAREGITVKSMRHSPDPATRESHYTHTLANSFRQGGNAPALYAKSEGADTILLALNLVDQYQGVLVRADSPYQNLEDLRGKRLAVPVRTTDKIDFWRATALQGCRNVLAAAGMSLTDLRLVEIPSPHSYLAMFAEVNDDDVDVPRLHRQHLAETLALLRGEVDVIMGYSAWGVSLREQFNLRQLAKVDSNAARQSRVNNGFPETLTVSGGLLRDHPELVDRYVQQLQRAVAWGEKHADAVRRILAQEIGVAEYWISEGTTANLAMTLDSSALAALDERKAFLLEHGFLRHDFELKHWMDPGPLLRAQAPQT